MEQSMEDAAILPNGESLASDLILGHPLHFEGVAHEKAGPRDVEGTIHWSTVTPGILGDRSIAGENQRDVVLLFVTRIGEEFDEDPDGVQDTRLMAFGYGFMRKLLERDPDAEAELLKLAESHPGRKIRHEIRRA